MSRFYLILLVFLFGSNFAFSQTELSKYLKYGEDQYKKGDFFSALELYKKALDIDSNSVAVNWAYAETSRAYKDYRTAEKYYQIVYDKEETLIYPSSLLQLGLMQKQNGKYSEAIETFKLAKKKYAKRKKEYEYLKARRELESCLWAKNTKDSTSLIISPIVGDVNTPNAEFGHLIIDSVLIFSSLKADSISSQEEVYDKNYHTHLYKKSLKQKDSDKEVEAISELFEKTQSNGNGTFSLDKKRFYYSSCKDEGFNYSCKIMVCSYKNGKWSKPDSLGPIINVEGANTTMPCIASWDKNEYLVFSSDRPGGEGGLDLYYSPIKNGNQFGKVRNIKALNSLDNEVSAFWSAKDNKLYFSSSWWDGFGGTDVYSSEYNAGFQAPVNLGLPINSPANDLYYFQNENTEFVTSNRIGVQFSKNPTCCSDIFEFKKPLVIPPPTKKETLEELSKRLPVTLYFHNDEPNPKSTATTSNVNYLTSYTDYRAMLEKYQKEYSSGLGGEKAEEAKEDIESFFIEFVDQGVKDLNLFRDLLLDELKKGSKINLTIKGFASPLAKSDYNVNLTKRRIASLVNYLSEYQNGAFVPYIKRFASNGGELTFTEVPFGEYKANIFVSDNVNDQKNSVYSRAAGLERKIEILSVNFIGDKPIENVSYTEKPSTGKDLKQPNTTDAPLTYVTNVKRLGKIKSTNIVQAVYYLKNTNNHSVSISSPRIPCECSKVEISKTELKTGESAKVTFILDPKGYSGNLVKSIYLKTNNSSEEIRLIIQADIEK